MSRWPAVELHHPQALQVRQPPPRPLRPLRPLRPPCLRCRLRRRLLRLPRSRNEHDPRRRLVHTSALSLLVKIDLARLAPPRLLRLLRLLPPLPPLDPPLVPLVPKERTCNQERLARLLVRLLVLNRLLVLRLDPPLHHHDDQRPARDRCLPISAYERCQDYPNYPKTTSWR